MTQEEKAKADNMELIKFNKQSIIDYLESDGEKNEKVVSLAKQLLQVIEKEESYSFVRNAMLNKQCYNCALRKECKKERPDTYEPIGTCDKWEDEDGLRTLLIKAE